MKKVFGVALLTLGALWFGAGEASAQYPFRGLAGVGPRVGASFGSSFRAGLGFGLGRQLAFGAGRLLPFAGLRSGFYGGAVLRQSLAVPFHQPILQPRIRLGFGGYQQSFLHQQFYAPQPLVLPQPVLVPQVAAPCAFQQQYLLQQQVGGCGQAALGLGTGCGIGQFRLGLRY